MAPQPRIDVYLETAGKICFLDYQPRFSLVVLLTLSSERPIVFIKNGIGPHAGLAQLLTSKCLECIDTKTGQRIPVFSNNKKKPQPISSNIDSPELRGLEPQRTDYVTFTNSLSPRAYEFEFVSSK